MQPDQTAPSTENPQSTVEQPASDPKVLSPHSPRSKKKPIMIAAVAVILIAAGTMTALSLRGKSGTTQSSAKKQADNSQKFVSNDTSQDTSKDVFKDSFDDSFDVIKDIKNSLAKEFVVMTDGKPDNGSIIVSKGTGAPLIKLADYKYFEAVDSGSSIDVSHDTSRLGKPDSDGVKLEAIFKSALEAAGLKLVTDNTQLLDTTQILYKNDTYTCQLDDANSSPMGVSCGKNADYAAIAKNYQPYYDSYIASLPADKAATAKIGFGGKITIVDGATSGYKLATISMFYGYGAGIDGGNGMFWSKNNGAWQFFDISQSSHSCADLKTDDQRNAYVGATCTSDKVF